jgi:hypothetical protein
MIPKDTNGFENLLFLSTVLKSHVLQQRMNDLRDLSHGIDTSIKIKAVRDELDSKVF